MGELLEPILEAPLPQEERAQTHIAAPTANAEGELQESDARVEEDEMETESRDSSSSLRAVGHSTANTETGSSVDVNEEMPAKGVDEDEAPRIPEPGVKEMNPSGTQVEEELASCPRETTGDDETEPCSQPSDFVSEKHDETMTGELGDSSTGKEIRLTSKELTRKGRARHSSERRESQNLRTQRPSRPLRKFSTRPWTYHCQC